MPVRKTRYNYATNVNGIKKNKKGLHVTTDGVGHINLKLARAHQRGIVRESKMQALIAQYFPRSTGKLVSVTKIAALMATDMGFKTKFLKLSWY